MLKSFQIAPAVIFALTALLAACSGPPSTIDSQTNEPEMSPELVIGSWGGYVPLANPEDFAHRQPPMRTEDGLLVYGLEIEADNRFRLTTSAMGWYGDWLVQDGMLVLTATGAFDSDRDQQYLPEFENGQSQWMIDVGTDGKMTMPIPKEEIFASETMTFFRRGQ